MKLQELINYYTSLNPSNTVLTNSINLDILISNITDNFNEISPKTLFIAIKGAKFNTLELIDAAIANGAELCVVDDESYLNKHNMLIVDNARKFLSASLYYYNNIFVPKNLFCVTGTNGKTSVTYFVSQLLNLLQRPNLLVGTTGVYLTGTKVAFSITTPKPTDLLNFFKIAHNKQVTHAILEASSHAISQFRLYSLNFISVGFTNLSQDHLDYHGNMQDYFEIKKSLFTNYNIENACINVDNSYGLEIAKSLNSKVNLLDYGYTANYCKIISITSDNTFSQEVTVNINNINCTFSVNLIGSFMVYNVLCAMLMIAGMGVSFADLCQLTSELKSVEGRLDLVKIKLNSKENAKVFVDYAHTPDALENILNTLSSIKQNSRLIVVFGCGGERDTTKRPLMGSIANKYADLIVLTNDNPRHEDENKIIQEIILGITDDKKVNIITNRELAIKYALGCLNNDDILVIAGKGHEDSQIIKDKTVPFNDKQVLMKLAEELGLNYEV